MLWLWITLIVIASIILLFILATLIVFFMSLKAKSLWNTDNKPWVPHIDEPELKQRALDSMDRFRREGKMVYVKAYDDVKLAGKLFVKEHAKQNIILFHGYRGKPEGDFCLENEWLKDLDVNILCIYQRGIYPSEGKYITMGYKESKDVHSWVNFILSQYDLPTYLWGVSMGASSVMFALKEKMPKQIKGIIADCGYTNAYEQFKNEIKPMVTTPVAVCALFFYNIWCHLFLHFGLKKLNTKNILSSNEIPTLFVHGKNDKFVLPYFAEQNHAANKGAKSLLLVDNAGHNKSFCINPEEYKKEVLKLLKNK